MPVRMVDYVVSLYQDLKRNGQLTDKKLPPVLPLVLYNGQGRWSAPVEINDMIIPVPGLERYQLHMRHLLLDEGALTEAMLEPLRNLAAALFRLEKSPSPEHLQELVRQLAAWLKAPEQTSLRRAFTVWLRRVLLPQRMAGVAIPEMTDLHEVDTMLADRVQEWTKPWREEGWREGLREGELKGLRDGEMRTLLRQIQYRFGPALDWVHRKLAEADLKTLETWTERILDAESLPAVFQ